MSKFGLLMDYLELSNYRIEKRQYPEGIISITPQEQCIVPLKLCEISPECQKACKAKIVELRGQINELGIGGYMSNQKDPFAPTTHRPSEGIKLREPHTIIIGVGKSWAATDRELTKQGIFILTPEICKQFEYPEEKKK